tara:strand:- start:888 stop:1811 length:924 start_codon:yes stop_codon:yes gene_type:complete
MKKNNKSKSITTKLVVAVLSISLFGFVFKSDIVRFFTTELSGCTDIMANNYNSDANTDDGSCIYPDGTPNHLRLAIEEFKINKWNKNEYFLLRDKILLHFSSLNESGSNQEFTALNNLDLAYMIVLHNETKKSVKNCFKYSNSLSNEVYKFYKDFKKENEEIRKARSIFRKKLQITKNKKKVSELLLNEYNKEAVKKLKDEIQTFKSLNIYKEFEKCDNLKKIIDDAEMNLEEFKDIHYEFRTWNNNRSRFDKKVPPRVISRYSDYKWYNDTILAIDSQLRKKEEDRLERKRIRDMKKIKKSNLELK